MDWKKRYDKPEVGKRYKLRRDSDKSDWRVEQHYDMVYEITSIGNESHNISLKTLDGTHPWHMDEEFLKEHFKVV